MITSVLMASARYENKKGARSDPFRRGKFRPYENLFALLICGPESAHFCLRLAVPICVCLLGFEGFACQ